MEAPIAGQPRQRPLRHDPVVVQLVTWLDATPGYPDADSGFTLFCDVVVPAPT
jgi:hypothetical protein